MGAAQFHPNVLVLERGSIANQVERIGVRVVTIDHVV